MIEIVIPLSQILNAIPIEIIFSIFFIAIGSLLSFIFRSAPQLVMLGALCICMGLICLLQYISFFMIVPSMPLVLRI
jgi:1,4-dihydroxy-2-naphthoate octaprenyltransferase